jgi:hypothetical protein
MDLNGVAENDTRGTNWTIRFVTQLFFIFIPHLEAQLKHTSHKHIIPIFIISILNNFH